MTPHEIAAVVEGQQAKEDRLSWMIGLYVQEAFASVLTAAFSKGGKSTYPGAPHLEQKGSEQRETEEEREAREEQERLRARLYMSQMVRAGKGWGKGA